MFDYYRLKDTDLLEKALLNIDLSKYPSLLEIRHICETEYLSSALVYLLTNLFDSKDEEVSLFNYYHRIFRIQYASSCSAHYIA